MRGLLVVAEPGREHDREAAGHSAATGGSASSSGSRKIQGRA